MFIANAASKIKIAMRKRSDEIDRKSDRFDDAGIGLLAAPYIADAGGSILKHFNKTRAAGEAIHNFSEKYMHTEGKGFNMGKAREIAGLALVAPGVTRRLARATTAKRSEPTEPEEPKTAEATVPRKPPQEKDEAELTAAKIGQLLARTGKIAGAKTFVAGTAGLAAIGGGLYAGKKAIDTIEEHVTHPHQAARYPGVAPGMAPASSV